MENIFGLTTCVAIVVIAFVCVWFAARNMSNPIDNSNFLIDSSDISNKAMKMFEREEDIKKFTRLAISDPENTSENERMQELFKKGIVDVFEDSTIASLSSNKSLLDDLGL